MSWFWRYEENLVFWKGIRWGGWSLSNKTFKSFCSFGRSSWLRAAHHLNYSEWINGKIFSTESKFIIRKLFDPFIFNLGINSSLKFWWILYTIRFSILFDQVCVIIIAYWSKIFFWSGNNVFDVIKFTWGALEKWKTLWLVVNGFSRWRAIKLNIWKPFANGLILWTLIAQIANNLTSLNHTFEWFLSLSTKISILVIATVDKLSGNLFVC